jgi:hypothetical protein
MVPAGPAIASLGVAEAVPAPTVSAFGRRGRRIFRENLAVQLRDALPRRTELVGLETVASAKLPATPPGAVQQLANKVMKGLGFEMKLMSVQLVEPRASRPTESPSSVEPRIASFRSTLSPSREYYWTGRKDQGGLKNIRLIKIETDAEGNALRSTELRSA